MPRRLMINGLRKKPRETRREMDYLSSWSSVFPETFPESLPGRENWYCKVPVSEHVVHGTNARRRARRASEQSLLNACERLQRIKPTQREHARVVAAITIPTLFSSSIDVFFTERAWLAHIDRNGPEYWLKPLPAGRSLLMELSLQTEFSFDELGFKSVIQYDDKEYYGEVWFLGDIGTRGQEAG